jgi:hypothetical protein
MNPRRGIPVTTLVIAALTAAVLGWLGLRWWVDSGHAMPQLSWVGVAAILVLAGGLLAAGWPVKKLRDGVAEHVVSPLRAARVLVLAQAGALTGAVLFGWYAAGVLVLLPDVDVASIRSDVWMLVAHAGSAAVLSAAGLVVQSWCRIVPPDEDETGPEDLPG